MILKYKKSYTTLAIAAALSLANVGVVNAATVTIQNPGFEDGFDNWNDDDPSAISSDSNSGSKSVKITGSGGRVDQTVSLTANTDYVLTAYVEGDGEIGVNLGSSTESTKTSDDDWTKVTVSFNSGSATSGEVFAKYYNGTGRFDDFTLTSSGTSTPTPTPSGSTSVPALIQAEDYTDYSDTTSGNKGGEYTDDDVDVQTTSDTDGGYNVGWIVAGEWLEYPISVSDSGDYSADIRLASSKSTGSFNVLVDGSLVDSVSLSSTGGWQNWTTKSVDLGSLSAGDHDIRIDVTGSNFNINWIDVQEEGSTTPTPTPSGSDIPSNITDGSLFDLEGDDPHPLVDSKTLEFVALEAKVTTENGNGWRHEYKIKSDLRVAMTDTYEYFKADIKVDLSDGGKTIVAQHHASDTGTIMKLYVADSSESDIGESTPDNGKFAVYVRIRNTSGDEEKKALGVIESGDSFTFEVINNYGVVSVTAFGETLTTEVEDDSESYLKFGNYLQSQYPDGSVDCGESGDSDSFEECFEDIGITTAKITMTDVTYERTTK